MDNCIYLVVFKNKKTKVKAKLKILFFTYFYILKDYFDFVIYLFRFFIYNCQYWVYLGLIYYISCSFNVNTIIKNYK